jgi:Omp85 superfamily domain
MRRPTRVAILAILWLGIASHASEAGAQSSFFGRWLDPSTAPFIPVPEIDVDPNSGTTLGIIPTWIHTDEHDAIRRIIAPDVIHNPFFGFGARARVLAFPSEDTQWSVVGGAKERVESEFNALYDTGRLRLERWSITAQAVYDRSGTPRFYGIGNESRVFNQTVYTDQQMFLEGKFGWNLTHNWQIAYTALARKVKILRGSLSGIPSIDRRFGRLGIGTTHEMLNRLSLTYDTRDDLTIPTHGMALVAYGGLASRAGAFNDSLFSEVGGDARFYWSPTKTLTWAAHVNLRYMPTTHSVPFWALSSIGGDQSSIDGSQPLRGFGTSRFYDRNSFSASLEMRKQVASFDAVSTHIDLQVTPFVDTGDVFPSLTAWPIRQLHNVLGVGFRALARPSVVGYVDIGRGSEGVAVFTGINYPF